MMQAVRASTFKLQSANFGTQQQQYAHVSLPSIRGAAMTPNTAQLTVAHLQAELDRERERARAAESRWAQAEARAQAMEARAFRSGSTDAGTDDVVSEHSHSAGLHGPGASAAVLRAERNKAKVRAKKKRKHLQQKRRQYREAVRERRRNEKRHLKKQERHRAKYAQRMGQARRKVQEDQERYVAQRERFAKRKEKMVHKARTRTGLRPWHKKPPPRPETPPWQRQVSIFRFGPDSGQGNPKVFLGSDCGAYADDTSGAYTGGVTQRGRAPEVKGSFEKAYGMTQAEFERLSLEEQHVVRQAAEARKKRRAALRRKHRRRLQLEKEKRQRYLDELQTSQVVYDRFLRMPRKKGTLNAHGNTQMWAAATVLNFFIHVQRTWIVHHRLKGDLSAQTEYLRRWRTYRDKGPGPEASDGAHYLLGEAAMQTFVGGSRLGKMVYNESFSQKEWLETFDSAPVSRAKYKKLGLAAAARLALLQAQRRRRSSLVDNSLKLAAAREKSRKKHADAQKDLLAAIGGHHDNSSSDDDDDDDSSYDEDDDDEGSDDTKSSASENEDAYDEDEDDFESRGDGSSSSESD